jgi:hypothetical protein
MSIFSSCHSPKKLYQKEVAEFKSASSVTSEGITEEGISHLPAPVQLYFRNCGFIGTTKYNYAEVLWEKSYIKMQPHKKWMKLKTLQYNFVSEPSRVAYMRANILGIIPFEGRDKYHDGQGHMYGTIGRMINIFNAKEHEIALGSAIVVLSESLLIPSYALQNYIEWTSIDSLTAMGRFRHKGVDVCGTFHFNNQGEYIRFTSMDRPYSNPDGSFEIQPYTILIHSYQQQGNIRVAKDVSATWNLPNGDFEYWKGTIKQIIFEKE